MLASTPHCSTPPAASRAVRAALLSVLAAALVLAGSAAALSAGAYAGTPTAGLSSTASTEQAVTGVARSSTQPVSQPAAVKPAAPSAPAPVSAAVPPTVSHALTSATSAVTHSQAASPPSSGMPPPSTSQTVSSGPTQPQGPTRSVVAPLGGVVSQLAGGRGSAVTGRATQVVSLLITPNAARPPGGGGPAGTIVTATQRLVAATAPAVGAVQRSAAGALGAVTSAAPGGPALRGVSSHALSGTLPVPASRGGPPPAAGSALSLLSGPVLPAARAVPVVLAVVPAVPPLTGLPIPHLRALVEATGLPVARRPAPAEPPGLNQPPEELNLAGIGLLPFRFPPGPGAGHRTGGGARTGAWHPPPPAGGSRGPAMTIAGSQGRIAGPTPPSGTAQAGSLASFGPAAGTGCVRGGLEERIMESCLAGEGRLAGSLAGPAQRLELVTIFGLRAPPGATQIGAPPRGRPDLRPAPAPGAPGGLPDGVPGSAAAASGPGTAVFFLLTCFALLAALLSGRLLGLSGEAWRSAPFLLIPERPG